MHLFDLKVIFPAENVDKTDLFEGDMILTEGQVAAVLKGIGGVDIPKGRGSTTRPLWPGDVLVYDIDCELGKLLQKQTNELINEARVREY